MAPKNKTETAATAAATRPRRDRTAAVTQAPEPRANTPKKRGRPAKATVDEEPPTKRGRTSGSTHLATDAPKKRGPGRPTGQATTTSPKTTTPGTKNRGRPRTSTSAIEAPADGEGEEAPAVPLQEKAPPKRRGRPPKGGETTKIEADDGAAAEQLEAELQDTTEEVQAATSGERNAFTKNEDETQSKAQATNENTERQEKGDGNTTSAKNFWLMKAEQEDREEVLDNGTRINVKFTIDDLRAKSEPEPWDGVRNPTAAKNMREMKQGDLAFFYASGGKAGRKPGIVGIMEIVKEYEPDQTAWDSNTYGYVKDEKARGRWCVVHVEYRKKLTKPVHLSELQKHAKDSGPLSKLQELTAARLSVSKVTEPEWNFILGLVEGYEEERDK